MWFFVLLMCSYTISVFLGAMAYRVRQGTADAADAIFITTIGLCTLALWVCVVGTYFDGSFSYNVPVIEPMATFLYAELFGFPAGWFAEWRSSTAVARRVAREQRQREGVDRRVQKKLVSVRSQRRQADQALLYIRQAAGNNPLLSELLCLVNLLGDTNGATPSYLGRLFERVDNLTKSIRAEKKRLRSSKTSAPTDLDINNRGAAVQTLQVRLNEAWDLIRVVLQLLNETSDDVHVIRTAPRSEAALAQQQLQELMQTYNGLIARATGIVGGIIPPSTEADPDVRAAEEEINKAIAHNRRQNA